jgi:Zn-dependent metalloprotease
MFQTNKFKLFAALGISLFSFDAFAQEIFKQVEKNDKGAITFAVIDQSKVNSSARMADNILYTALNLKASDELRHLKSETDEKGFTHDKHQQYFKGIKVEYGTYTTHTQKGLVAMISGDFKQVGNISVTPALDEKTALRYAMKQIGAKSYMWENAAEEQWLKESEGNKEATFMPKGELVICENFAKADGSFALAYKFDIYAKQPISRAYVYVDAQTGQIIHQNAIIKHVNATGTAATRYSGSRTITTDQVTSTSYRLRETTRGLGIETYNCKKGTNYSTAVDFTDNDNNWTSTEFNNTAKDNAALDAHWGAAVTYDYWKNTHNRNSYDNAGAKIKSYVHFDVNYNNAYWNGSVMTYGDGSGTGGFNVLTALDVCGHEIGHAVCEKTANLAYQRESGAMNEGFSDIWGACIEAFGKNSGVVNANTWLIGEDIEMRSGKVSLRSMSNPNANAQPDTYGGTYWKTINCGNPTQANDYCGVHTNSGVLNYWFYLLAVGGTGTNDIGSVFNVTGISIDKAAKIAYRTEANYLSANSTFANARTGAIQAATDLYGAGSAEVIATTKAWFAVGVGADYTAPCSTPAVPAGLATASLTSTSVTLNWTANGATSYNVQYRVVGSATWTATTSATNSKAIAGLTAATNYEFQVAGVCTSTSAWSASATFTTPTTTLTYCASKGNSVADEWIASVKLSRETTTVFNNVSGANAGYGNFTGNSYAVGKGGAAYTITITPGWRATTYAEGYAVWVDYNNNGAFTDTGELVFSKTASTTSPASGSFTVPTTAATGNVRMRVSMKYNGVATSCEAFSYGEVEDYTLNLGGTAFARTDNSNETVATETSVNNSYTVYPNPVTDVLNIQFENLSESATIRIVTISGAEVYSGKATDKEFAINVNHLSRGLYVISIADEKGVVNHKFVKQ